MKVSVWGKTILLPLVSITFLFTINSAIVNNENLSISINPIGTYQSGIFNESAAEISAYDKTSKRLFVTNASSNSLDVLDVS